jgi:hypothetical protein
MTIPLLRVHEPNLERKNRKSDFVKMRKCMEMRENIKSVKDFCVGKKRNNIANGQRDFRAGSIRGRA